MRAIKCRIGRPGLGRLVVVEVVGEDEEDVGGEGRRRVRKKVCRGWMALRRMSWFVSFACHVRIGRVVGRADRCGLRNGRSPFAFSHDSSGSVYHLLFQEPASRVIDKAMENTYLVSSFSCLLGLSQRIQQRQVPALALEPRWVERECLGCVFCRHLECFLADSSAARTAVRRRRGEGFAGLKGNDRIGGQQANGDVNVL